MTYRYTLSVTQEQLDMFKQLVANSRKVNPEFLKHVLQMRYEGYTEYAVVSEWKLLRKQGYLTTRQLYRLVSYTLVDGDVYDGVDNRVTLTNLIIEFEDYLRRSRFRTYLDNTIQKDLKANFKPVGDIYKPWSI